MDLQCYDTTIINMFINFYNIVDFSVICRKLFFFVIGELINKALSIIK